MKGSWGALALAGLLLPVPAVSQDSPAVGDPAPAVTIASLDGRPVNLAEDYGRRPVLIEFWATWCPLCERLYPQIHAARERYGDRVALYGINVTVNQTREAVRTWLGAHQVPFTVLWDENGDAVRAFDVLGTSHVVVVDRTGRIAYIGYGAEQDLGAILEKVMTP